MFLALWGFAAIVVAVAVAATIVYVRNPYVLIDYVNRMIKPWNDEQNNALCARAAALAKCQKLQQPFGRVLGLCPADSCGYAPWESFEQSLRHAHDTIVQEIKDAWNNGHEGIAQVELCQVQKQNFPDQTGWKPMWIKLGTEYTPTSQVLPTLAQIVKNHDQHIILCFVSVMHPGTRLKPHVGPNMAAVRYHYPLIVPSGNVKLLLQGKDASDPQLLEWKERNGFIWNDTIEHAAWNSTNQVRVVLFVDLLRPLPWYIRWLTSLSLSALERSKYIRGMKEKLRAAGVVVDHH